SAQNASSSALALCRSPSRSAVQASRAHTAPPDVPLSPTSSYSSISGPSRSLLSTPAVNAVWLPPPWHAMAIRRRSAVMGWGLLVGWQRSAARPMRRRGPQQDRTALSVPSIEAGDAAGHHPRWGRSRSVLDAAGERAVDDDVRAGDERRPRARQHRD